MQNLLNGREEHAGAAAADAVRPKFGDERDAPAQLHLLLEDGVRDVKLDFVVHNFAPVCLARNGNKKTKPKKKYSNLATALSAR